MLDSDRKVNRNIKPNADTCDRPQEWPIRRIYHMYPLPALYFGQPFGRYPTFHALTSFRRKKLLRMFLNVATFSCCC